MYLQPGEWSNPAEACVREARSVGSILGEMREIAALRARRQPPAPRNALRRNSA